ncbi:uncharacterized protein LOC110434963 [Sorghum bicolor]|uniref:uncharacterized protein LOC110434963 n=1 Tax=Sorghum bicolor TaxID=4558 RepID=UPI000B424690|nr:uncharacterized protein LOC110434963 [Sorghum bicolor]|eukprot:XP_021315753.1 uncharacterized protein LOC110434963 [Sorghum bicolor]
MCAVLTNLFAFQIPSSLLVASPLRFGLSPRRLRRPRSSPHLFLPGLRRSPADVPAMDPPSAQVMSTTDDFQDKAVDECCSCCYDCCSSILDFLCCSS